MAAVAAGSRPQEVAQQQQAVQRAQIALDDAIRTGVERGVDAVVVWVIEEDEPAVGVAAARAAGVPVVALERPRYPVDASVVWPNFNQGVYMAQHLADTLTPRAEVAIVGGPRVVDDVELVAGLIHGVHRAGLTLVNDPWRSEYRNLTDVASGGKVAAANVLRDHPHIAGLIPFNDETMLGSLEALHDCGRAGTIPLVSRNGTPQAVQAVRDGVSYGTWDIGAPEIGELLADVVLRLTVGEEHLDGFCTASPIGRLITRDNLDSWIPWEERISYQPLHEAKGNP